MKLFTTIKVGYTKGTYGCSNEFFNTIYVDEKGMHSISHYGMYGSDDRVNNFFKDKGYQEKYIPSDFGKMTARNVWKGFISEEKAIEEIKNL